MIEIRRTDSNNKGFLMLCACLDRELTERYGAVQKNYTIHNQIDLINTVIIALNNNFPIACGCFKEFDNHTVEIKRMFVDRKYRGQGIAGLILKELESWAIDDGYNTAVLETGRLQPEALSLYQRSGYQIIENYRQYTGVENSICMLKILKNV